MRYWQLVGIANFSPLLPIRFLYQLRMQEIWDARWRRVDELKEFERLIRNDFIYTAVEIEHSIEVCIAWHFCKDEDLHSRFISYLFRDGQVTFSQKITILKKMLRDCYPDIFSDYKSVFKVLEKIREFRNQLAHSRRSNPVDYRAWIEEGILPEIGIYLEDHKDGAVHQRWKSEEEVNELNSCCDAVRAFVAFLTIEVKNRSTANPSKTFSLAMDSMKRLTPAAYAILRGPDERWSAVQQNSRKT